MGASNQKPADRGSTLLDQATSAAPAQIKIVQRAVVALLNAIYGEDFLGFSYGFRPVAARWMRSVLGSTARR